MDRSASTSTSIHVQANPSQTETSMPPKKRLKRHRKDKPGADGNHPICHLNRIPLEILAEVLSYTTPRDILALARSSKYYCDTLVKPSCDFIWKKARTRYTPAPIPDPTPNFTEASYAAFIFDYGKCEMCNKETKTMYASFALHVRLCPRSSMCRNTWRAQKAVEIRPGDVPRYSRALERLPSLEYKNFGHSSTLSGGSTAELSRPSGLILRKTQWASAMDEYNKAALEKNALTKYDARQLAAVQRKNRIMEHCMKLVKWRIAHEEEAKRVRSENLTIAKSTANGRWPLYDLLQTPSYGLLFHSKNKSLELITERDFALIQSSVEVELADLSETRRRREAENSYRQRREDVERYYKNLKANGGTGGILPGLSEFRKLPIVHKMQNKTTGTASSGIYKDLQRNKVINDLVMEDLTRWEASASASFAALLGYPGWKQTGGKVQLHPAVRPNALFLCKRCETRANGRRQCRSMSFEEACDHRCINLSKKERTKDSWNVRYFYPDTKAIDAVNQFLVCCGIKANDPHSRAAVGEIGTRILCLSCHSIIVMNYDMLLSHCKRHDEMRMKVLPQSQVEAFVNRPVEHGLLAQLTPSSPSAMALREKRVYGCRHCLQPGAADVPTEAESAPTTALSSTKHVLQGPTPADSSEGVRKKTRGSQPKAGQGRPPKMFTFDGLRSHVKEKHGILWIGDEDFYKEIADNTGVDTAPSTT